MQKQISGIELKHLEKELQILLDSRIDKIYSPAKKDLILQFFKRNEGKYRLNINLPYILYLTKHKEQQETTPSGYCMMLRKRLDGAFLTSLRQIGYERILEFKFQAKEATFFLIFEFYGKGNAILCDENLKIIAPIEHQKTTDRLVAPGQIYVYPKKEYSLADVNTNILEKLIASKDLVKALATDLGLGGLYAEELCLRLDIDKKAKSLSHEKLELLQKEIIALRDAKTESRIIYENGIVKDIVPFALKTYQQYEQKEEKSFNEAVSAAITPDIIAATDGKKEEAFNKDIDQVQKIIDQQEETLKRMEKIAIENQAAGELIYTNYLAVKEILSDIKESRKKKSWQEIKEKYKDHPLVKQIKEKEGKIVLEL